PRPPSTLTAPTHTCPQPRHSAEGEGFEPSVSLPTTVFKTATFGRSVNPPVRRHCCASARPQPNRPGPPARPCRTCSASTGLRRDYSATTPCLLAHPSRAHLYLLWTTDHPPGAYRGPMRAMVITDDAGMTPSDVSEPEAGPDEVVIDVAAAGVNRADLLQLKGLHPPPPGAATWPGLEVSGTISQVGADVTGWSVGDRVAALVDGGGYADRARARAGDLLAVPEHLDLAGAAAFPEALGTLWSNLAGVPGLDGPAALLRPHASAAPGSHAPTAAGRPTVLPAGAPRGRSARPERRGLPAQEHLGPGAPWSLGHDRHAEGHQGRNRPRSPARPLADDPRHRAARPPAGREGDHHGRRGPPRLAA